MNTNPDPRSMAVIAKALLEAVRGMSSEQAVQTITGALLLMGSGVGTSTHAGPVQQVATTDTKATMPDKTTGDLPGQTLFWDEAKRGRRIAASTIARWRNARGVSTPFNRLVQKAMLAGVSTEDIASACGVTRNHVSKWARCACVPTGGRVRGYSRAVSRLLVVANAVTRNEVANG